MGLRGPAPRLTLTNAAPLQDQTPPDHLGPAAAAYWTRHAPYLVANQLLTQATVDCFTIHCDVWQRLCDLRGQPLSRQYLDLEKTYSVGAKLFRLAPCDKPGSPTPDRHSDKPEFSFDTEN